MLFDDPADVGNLISGSSAFSKSSVNIWKFTVHVLLKPGLENRQASIVHEIPDVQDGFKKGKGTRNQIANIHWIIEKAREFCKSIYHCFIDTLKPLSVWIITNCGNS